MSDKTMREALEEIASFKPAKKDEFKGWQEWNRAGQYAADIASEALASAQPEGPELTDAEIIEIAAEAGLHNNWLIIVSVVREAIAAHEAKSGGAA